MYKKHCKEYILEKGKSLFRTQGYNKTGINEILKASEIPKGSFYNFFKSKEDFGLQVLTHYSEEMIAFIESMLVKDKSKPPLERLKYFYQTVMTANKEEQCLKGCLLVNMTTEMGGISQNFAKAAKDHYQKWIHLIAACIAEGQEKGEINRNYEANELAAYIHNNFSGALVMMKSKRDTSSLNLFYKMTFQFLEPR